jgi:hypothetical protein
MTTATAKIESEGLEKQSNLIQSSGQVGASTQGFNGSQPGSMLCPNCGSRLEGRKCKLFCPRPGCGYLVTCAEW